MIVKTRYSGFGLNTPEGDVYRQQLPLAATDAEQIGRIKPKLDSLVAKVNSNVVDVSEELIFFQWVFDQWAPFWAPNWQPTFPNGSPLPAGTVEFRSVLMAAADVYRKAPETLLSRNNPFIQSILLAPKANVINQEVWPPAMRGTAVVGSNETTVVVQPDGKAVYVALNPIYGTGAVVADAGRMPAQGAQGQSTQGGSGSAGGLPMLPILAAGVGGLALLLILRRRR